ncbi:unnamed protein product [Victoria cruziana]
MSVIIFLALFTDIILMLIKARTIITEGFHRDRMLRAAAAERITEEDGPPPPPHGRVSAGMVSAGIECCGRRLLREEWKKTGRCHRLTGGFPPGPNAAGDGCCAKNGRRRVTAFASREGFRREGFCRYRMLRAAAAARRTEEDRSPPPPHRRVSVGRVSTGTECYGRRLLHEERKKTA